MNLKPSVTDAYVYHDEGTDREVLVMGRTHHHMKTADEKAEASRRAPILDINSPLTSPDKLRAVKCRCNKSWCPSCSKNTIIKKTGRQDQRLEMESCSPDRFNNRPAL